MRIMIDIDGTISELKSPNQDYSEIKVNLGAVEKIKALKAAGHYIILQTARHMKSCNGDQGQVVAKIGKKTLDWLEKNDIPYDEIYFGKPWAHVYLDDLAQTFTSWRTINVSEFDSNFTNIVIPMAGHGSRFVKAGYDTPKPLIDILGEPMIKWAMKSFDFLDKVQNYRLIFIILRKHEVEHGLATKLKDLFGSKTEVAIIDDVTRGQAETTLAAKKYINNFNRLFVYNCDTYATSPIWEMIEREDPDGILPCFKSTDPRFSFARIDDSGYVVETTEKNPVSDLASSGMYYFKRGRDFVAAAEEALDSYSITANGEFYIAPLYNTLLESGKKIRTVLIDKNYVMGTPEELAEFLKTYPKKQ